MERILKKGQLAATGGPRLPAWGPQNGLVCGGKRLSRSLKVSRSGLNRPEPRRSRAARWAKHAITPWAAGGQLRRFLDYGQLELSNNLAENATRPVAVGRKNWLHFRSERAGPRVAAIISRVETCRRPSIPVRNYLGSVLPGLASFPINRIAELTPTAWAARVEIPGHDSTM